MIFIYCVRYKIFLRFTTAALSITEPKRILLVHTHTHVFQYIWPRFSRQKEMVIPPQQCNGTTLINPEKHASESVLPPSNHICLKANDQRN